MPPDDRAIAVSATFTAEAIQPGLAFWAAELGLDCEIRFAGYNQLFQQLLDPAGLFARNRGGWNVALVRFEDGLEGHVPRLVDAVRSAAAAFSAPLILVTCPPTPDREIGFVLSERALHEGISRLPSVHTISAADLRALYPVSEVHDPHGDELGHLPYTPLFFVALATAIARKIHAISTPPYKVVALDCDETLWAGICGEDGPQNVVVDPPRRRLQEFMVERRRSGMLLTLCSKNNEEDVVETFRAHPDMPLRLEDFAAHRVNWQSKGENLAALGDELELGLDSFILVDDSAKECTEAQAQAPEVLALALPAEAEEIPAFLQHVWAFDRARVTEEDRRRPELYSQRAERARAERAAGNLEEFLASLQLEIRISPMEPHQVSRVAQLTQRTNQMNATCLRRTEAEVQTLAPAECLTVEVQDRFGSYGLTGAMIFREQGGALVVDTFLLSCRALGRGVEHRMVARLGEIALERGLARVEIGFVSSNRNRPAALFLESLRPPDPDGVFRLAASEAAAVRYKPGKGEPRAAAAEERSGRGPEPARRINYVRIATELRDPVAILERIRAASLRSAPPQASFDPPRTPLERELAELFANLLNLPAVGIHDNFFELGGHSLLAVQLLSRVRQIYAVELSLEVVYSGEFTVAELAKAVELKEIEQSGGDYQDLLRELEGLSDEEARALLAEEQDAS
ncbi:MAG TPA: HAD-IIIC family phosphatase [Bryobacteraceae bacterium]